MIRLVPPVLKVRRTRIFVLIRVGVVVMTVEPSDCVFREFLKISR